MKKFNFTLAKSLLVTVFLSSQFVAFSQQKQLVEYVDPFIGVLDEPSACVIGPQLPNGSISPSPQTINGNDDGYSPKEPIRGFAQLTVSGTGWGKYGQIFFSPQIGLAIGETNHDSSKENEVAKAYEYSVKLSRYGIKTDFTPSVHSAIYRFTFPESTNSNLVFDLSHHLAVDIKPALKGKIHDGSLTITSSTGNEIKGYGNYSGGFGDGTYRVYFCARFSKAPSNSGTWYNGVINPGQTSEKLQNVNDKVGAYFQYTTKANEEIYMKVAVSFKSIEQATIWLDSEIPAWDYNKVKETAKQKWNEQLNKIVIEGGSATENKIFYTAMYHTSLMPRNRINDSEHFGKDVPVWDDHFAIWDTWRTVYPLKVLIDPDMVSGTINSFIARLNKNGRVRDAYIAGYDMNMEQGGNNIDNVIADAYIKGVKGVDWKEAYKVLKFNADNERLGSYAWTKNDSTNTYKKTGWIPLSVMGNSMTLEYAYNDFCAAEVAKGLGLKADYKKYFERSGKWINLWDANAESDGFKGFIMSKKLDGTFVDIYEKQYPGSWKMHFYEGCSWTYSYFMPHQFPRLIEISGGEDAYIKKLQHGVENKLLEYDNEPAFLAIHSFHYAGRSDLASFYTRKLLKERFNLEGYSGNDDSGAMSSWYIFSTMGFFPNAGQDIYYLVGPLFKKASLTLGNGKSITVIAPNASPENIYIKSVKINGKKWKTFYFNHKDIANGAIIEFDMTNLPVNFTE